MISRWPKPSCGHGRTKNNSGIMQELSHLAKDKKNRKKELFIRKNLEKKFFFHAERQFAGYEFYFFIGQTSIHESDLEHPLAKCISDTWPPHTDAQMPCPVWPVSVHRRICTHQTKSVKVSVLTILLTLISPRMETDACTSAAAENAQRTILFVSESTFAVT